MNLYFYRFLRLNIIYLKSLTLTICPIALAYDFLTEELRSLRPDSNALNSLPRNAISIKVIDIMEKKVRAKMIMILITI